MNIIKRDGSEVLFDPSKIYNAISSANKDAKDQAPTKVMSSSMIHAVTDKVVSIIEEECDDDVTCTVEDVQDLVESELMKTGNYEIAKIYILYRQKRKEQRDAAENLMKSYNDLLFADAEDMDLKRDNANINTDAPMGIMLKLGTEGAKSYVDNYFLDPEMRDADKAGILHYHDKDFSMICFNCCQIDLGKLFKGGFSTGHGFLREPNSIRSASALACIAIQSNQNDMFGGQSINAWDFALAPYVEKSFKKAFRANLSKVTQTLNGFNALDMIKEIPDEEIPNYKGSFDFSDFNKLGEHIKTFLNTYFPFNEDLMMSLRPNGCNALKEALKFAEIDVEEETKQAMEAAIFNFNSLHSRAGRMTA